MARLEPHTIPTERRFQLLVEAVTDYAIYMLDTQGRVASWNAGAERIKGFMPADVLGRHFSMFFTEEDRRDGLPQRALATARATGRFESEGWRIRKDGSRFWALGVLDAVHDESGALIGFAKITRDMTERMRTQQALLESERRFRLLVEGVSDYAIFMLDPEGRVTNWNLGAQRIKGYSAEEVIGEHYSRFFPEEDRAQGLPAEALRIAEREGKYEAEGWRVRKDGSRFYASVVINAIRDEAGNLLGFGKITRDITERREAQQALEETREQLFQAQKLEALGQLTGGVAHDFNNLLTIIVGAVSLAERRIGDIARLKRYLASIREAAQRGENLTKQLLAFSRRQTLRPEVVDVTEKLSEVVRLLGRSLRADIQIVLETAKDLWPIEVDPTQLELALLNVSLNARDAMPKGGTLTITSRNVTLAGERGELDGDFVAISLSDVGTGIPEEIKERIFEPFFTTKEVGRGSGLGLSQAYGFAKQSGGALSVESEVGRGTTVTFYLPVAVSAPAEAPAERPTGPSTRSSGTVLVVEDDPAVAETAVGILEQSGYAVRLARGAGAALDLLERGEMVDLVFSDIVMPAGMNGVELARTIRAHFPTLPVLLATGFSEAAMTADARGFPLIAKPYDPDRLLETIAELIGEARARDDGGPAAPRA